MSEKPTKFDFSIKWQPDVFLREVFARKPQRRDISHALQNLVLSAITFDWLSVSSARCTPSLRMFFSMKVKSLGIVRRSSSSKTMETGQRECVENCFSWQYWHFLSSSASWGLFWSWKEKEMIVVPLYHVAYVRANHSWLHRSQRWGRYRDTNLLTSRFNRKIRIIGLASERKFYPPWPSAAADIPSTCLLTGIEITKFFSDWNWKQNRISNHRCDEGKVLNPKPD